MFYYLITFIVGTGQQARVLRSDEKLETGAIKQYYTKYSKMNGFRIKSVVPIENEKNITNLNIDNYLKFGDLYAQRALEYSEHYGIVTYKVVNNKMTYNQNYNNSECIGGVWKRNPCTYRRTVNLDTLEVKTEKLQRLQRNGWDNV